MAPRLKEHAWAFAVALGIGLLFGLPNIFFAVSLGSEYRGIPLLQTPNEDSYLARIQEVTDGHGALGSPFLFEYKDEPPLSPPTGEWLYALPSVLFGVSPAATLIGSKFLLPAILFLLIYALIFRLTGGEGRPRALTALAGGMLTVLGYDLIDYRTVFEYLAGDESPGAFLLWARPVNPILGALFLFSFLLIIWSLAERREKPVVRLGGAGVFLALMFGSYFFSWGMALSVLAALVLTLLVRGEYKTAGMLSLIVPVGALFSSPYWFFAWRAAKSPWYEGSVLRSGLFLTHYPLLNKLLLVALVLYALVLFYDFYLKKRTGSAFVWEGWHSFVLAFLLGGVWAYSQQMLTGRTIWPYHFVQYTIPLAMVSGVVVLHRIIRARSIYVWGTFVSAALAASLAFGVYTQVVAYTKARPHAVHLQTYAPLFAWLNRGEKDCVVFVNETNEEMMELNTLIPAFTHCNRYTTTELLSLLPAERAVHGYLSLLRLRGISPEGIDAYLAAARSEAAGYLYADWKGLFGVKDFPDVRDTVLEQRLQEFPALYRAFAARDFRAELRRYRLDYILSNGPLEERVARELRGLEKVFEASGKVLYAVD